MKNNVFYGLGIGTYQEELIIQRKDDDYFLIVVCCCGLSKLKISEKLAKTIFDELRLSDENIINFE